MPGRGNDLMFQNVDLWLKKEFVFFCILPLSPMGRINVILHCIHIKKCYDAKSIFFNFSFYPKLKKKK